MAFVKGVIAAFVTFSPFYSTSPIQLRFVILVLFPFATSNPNPVLLAISGLFCFAPFNRGFLRFHYLLYFFVLYCFEHVDRYFWRFRCFSVLPLHSVPWTSLVFLALLCYVAPISALLTIWMIIFDLLLSFHAFCNFGALDALWCFSILFPPFSHAMLWRFW